MNVNEIESHLTKKYLIKKRLGKGAYGIVWKAIDKKSLEVVALKKIFDAFRNATDAQRTFREIMFLQAFGDHRNIIKLRNVIKAANDKDIYLVFEFMDTDLHNVIKKGDILSEIHRQFIMYQLLAAIKYMHSGNVIHRDLKPSNILLDGQCIVKVCDFGLARSLSQIHFDEQGDANLTEYVATRWYRAPEILLASSSYTKGVDLWSLGCILGEMLCGKPLFPGSSTLSQVERIIASIDPPSNEDVASLQSTYGPSLLKKAANRQRVPLEQLVYGNKSDCEEKKVSFDLLKKLLHFNPTKRLTTTQAINHPYVKRFRNEHNEVEMWNEVLNPIPDDVQLSIEEYRQKLYEVVAMNKKKRAIINKQHGKEDLKSEMVKSEGNNNFDVEKGDGDAQILKDAATSNISKKNTPTNCNNASFIKNNINNNNINNNKTPIHNINNNANKISQQFIKPQKLKPPPIDKKVNSDSKYFPSNPLESKSTKNVSTHQKNLHPIRREFSKTFHHPTLLRNINAPHIRPQVTHNLNMHDLKVIADNYSANYSKNNNNNNMNNNNISINIHNGRNYSKTSNLADVIPHNKVPKTFENKYNVITAEEFERMKKDNDL